MSRRDLKQEAYLFVLEHPELFEHASDRLAYTRLRRRLLSGTIRQCKRIEQRDRRQPMPRAAAIAARGQPTPAELVERKFEVRRLMSSLSESDRQFLRELFVDGWSRRELAKRYGCTSQNLDAKWFRIFRDLRWLR